MLDTATGEVANLALMRGGNRVREFYACLAARSGRRFLQSLLFEVKPTDPLTFVGVAILLAIVAAAARYIPARRAMNIDPMVALRHE
jgi:ABC-type lipoprotein release transport system permease subunit